MVDINPNGSYDPAYFAPLFASEERHFWFRARNKIIAAVIDSLVADLEKGYRVLEVGCGTGNVLGELVRVCSQGMVVGMDLFAEGLYYAQQRVSCGLVQGDLLAPPFKTQFDLVCLFDVLEHMQDDVGILQALSVLLKPGGRIVLTVPAHNSLWSYFDEASHHCRRYTISNLSQCLAKAGYQVEYITEYMSVLLPLVWLGRKLTTGVKNWGVSSSAESDVTYTLATRELRIVPVLNDILCWLLGKETYWIERRRQLLFGTSIIAIACNGEDNLQE